MTSHKSHSRTADFAGMAALLGSASFVVMAATAAYGQGEASSVEEVLVTGSLIRGAPAVGVPVTALSAEDFAQSGALSVTNILKSVPALRIDSEASPIYGGGTLSFEQNVQIHGLGTGAGVETLLMVDGLRWPAQNYSSDTVNPSIVAELAIDRIDVLTAGASAVYGSDATSGVINIILKRGFDGAISQASISESTDIGNINTQASQLYGRKWDGGDITLSYEFSNETRVKASSRPYYTLNFEPYGLMDLTPLASSAPGVITTGAPVAVANLPPGGFAATLGTRFCANCYSVPKGTGWNYGDTAAHTNPTQPGSAPTTTWTALLANQGVKNERNPWLDGDARPQKQNNDATLTFDQNLTNDLYGVGPVSLFAEAFYSNQRGKQVYPPPNGNAREGNTPTSGQVVPTTNPYYPAGAPAGLRVNYDLAIEMPSIVTGGEVAGRYAFGFNFDHLPYDWRGKVTYSMTDDLNFGDVLSGVNVNNLSAALGNTVASIAGVGAAPSQSAFTKPANVPYLNLFCDATVFQCNSRVTLDYILGFRNQTSHWKVRETTVNFDGPLADLPGGQVKAAVAGELLTHHYAFTEQTNQRNASNAVVTTATSIAVQTSYAVFGQVDIPLVGEANALPLVQAFNIEAGYRYDKYDTLNNPIYTPKLAATWVVGGGLSLRGAWGKSFRAPAFGENSAVMSQIQGANALGGAVGSSNSVTLGCNSVGGSPTGVALAGSLTSLLNPTCSGLTALRQPGGLIVGGSARGAALVLRGGEGLKPQTVKQWSLGANFAPKEPIGGLDLTGLNVDVTLFNLHFNDLISGFNIGQGPDDPASTVQYTVIPHPELPITDPANATFLALVNDILAQPVRGVTFDPQFLTNIKFIQDSAITNIGTKDFGGIDFNARYDFELGDWGAWNVGVDGYYELINKSQANAVSPVTDVYKGKNSGNRLQRARYRLGWADGAWGVTAFANYTGHSGINTGFDLVPSCYFAPGLAAGACYPGSPYVGPFTLFPDYSPATVTVDLSTSYKTGDTPANPYLRNINVQLTFNNILNKSPPFQVGARGHGTVRAFDNVYDDQQRTVTLQVTKNW